MSNGEIECKEPKKFYKHTTFQIYYSVCDCCAIQILIDDHEKKFLRNVPVDYVKERLELGTFKEVSEQVYQMAEDVVKNLSILYNV